MIKFIFEFNLCISAHLRMSCVNHYGVLARKMIDRHKMIGKRRVSQIRRACAQTRFGVQVEGASVVSAMLWKERATRVQRDLDKKKTARSQDPSEEKECEDRQAAGRVRRDSELASTAIARLKQAFMRVSIRERSTQTACGGAPNAYGGGGGRG